MFLNHRAGEFTVLVKEKVDQAIAILQEYDIDCWITFVRESPIVRDPMLDFLTTADVLHP